YLSTPNNAAFTGINNLQTCLKGISFGNSLLKQVVQELKHELPQLETFVTLSPVPGLSHWLQRLRSGAVSGPTISDEQKDALALLNTPGWHNTENEQKFGHLRDILLSLAAWYL